MSNIRVRLKSRQAIRTKLRPQQGVKVDNQKLYLYDPSLIDDEVALARDWAIKTDGLVEEEDYSSKAWAIGGMGTETNNSKYYASQAATSAGNAYTSETNAAASASTATTQAGIATTQAGIATTKAGEASTSATTATTQAGIATTQAGIATTKAGEASTSATNAYNSASQASTSATNAYNSAGQAATSATSASNFADQSKQWAIGVPTEPADGSAKYWAGQAQSAVESIGDATLTIQKNGSDLGTFTANATVDKTIDIPIPTTASDVSALPDSTKYGAGLSLTINSTNYVMTAQLKDQDGNNLGTAQTIDLPLESVVVSGSYDSVNKKIVLTLQNGTTIDIPVGDLISGLQTEITENNKLNADLVDDSTSTNKFVTASDITTWNGKQDALTAGTNITIENNVISSTAQESFFRGRWEAWADVPTQANLYPADYIGNRTPTNNDYMVVSDASGYVPDLSNMPRVEFRNMRVNPDGVQGASICDVFYYPDGINEIITYNFNCVNNGTYKAVADGKVLANWWYGHSWTIKANAPVYYDGRHYNSGDVIYNGGNRATIKIYFLDSIDTYEGSWRFSYHGIWATDNTSGWKPEYQLENVLPIASPTEQGIAKLYTTTGQNTDGSMTQKSVTDSLAAKQDTISDLSTIRTNASNGASAYTTIQGYGDIVTHNASEFATSAQGALADTAVQPSDLATVATTGDYGDLLNKPTIPAAQIQSDWTQADNTKLDYIKNKPTLASVATSGDYDDLINKPTIPAAQVNSDWDAVSGVAQILNKPSLATVATSGLYSDLSGTPTIPTVNNSTITLTQGGVTKGSFTLNQSSGATIDFDAGGGGGSLPSQTGHSGEFLTTDGTDASWAVATKVTLRRL